MYKDAFHLASLNGWKFRKTDRCLQIDEDAHGKIRKDKEKKNSQREREKRKKREKRPIFRKAHLPDACVSLTGMI